jgi:thiamine pyrophosphokinase
MTTERTRHDTAIVLLGGTGSHAGDFGELPTDARVIAADSGVELADMLGLRVDTVIGDMDSIHPTSLAALSALDVEIVPYSTDKDATDAELAIIHAARLGAERLLVLGAGGGRLDHQLSIFSVMFHDELRSVRVELRVGGSRAHPIRDGGDLVVRCGVGSIVGLIPFGGDVHGVSTQGLRWSLDDGSLAVTASRGVSNRAVDDEIRVSVRSGRLIVTIDQPDDRRESE